MVDNWWDDATGRVREFAFLEVNTGKWDPRDKWKLGTCIPFFLFALGYSEMQCLFVILLENHMR